MPLRSTAARNHVDPDGRFIPGLLPLDLWVEGSSPSRVTNKIEPPCG